MSTESDRLMGGHDSHAACYEANKEEVVAKRLQYEPSFRSDGVSMWDEAIEQVQKDVQRAQEEAQLQELLQAHGLSDKQKHLDDEFDAGRDFDAGKDKPKLKKDRAFEMAAMPAMMTDDPYRSSMRQLNPEQRHFINFVQQTLRRKPDAPIRVFCSGGAGVGKTFALRMLHQTLFRTARGRDPAAAGAGHGFHRPGRTHDRRRHHPPLLRHPAVLQKQLR